ncbi:VCBS repeat-containing protein [bacterium]|nr:VCBS repeat-containing protein [bacterium]
MKFSKSALLTALTIIYALAWGLTNNANGYPAAPESTALVSFSYDDGSSASYLGDLTAGDGEMMKFSAEHPCSIFTIWFYTSGTGDMEIHVWADMSNQADFSINYITPFIFHCEGTGWKEINLRDPLVLPGLTVFHIGYFKFDAPAPYLHYADNHIDEARAHLYDVSEDTWYYIGSGDYYFPYMIRADGKYFDIRTEFEFTEVASDVGLGGGSLVSWGDYDNDNDEDLLAGGTLYRNDRGHFTNVTAEAGISGGGGATWGDYDNDGYLDFYVCAGANNDKLWHNLGDGTFEDVTVAAGNLYDPYPSAACGWGDYDNDGDIDLYVANAEFWSDTLVEHYPDIFYKNNGDGTFTDATEEVGMGVVDDPPLYGRGVAWCDFDKDGDQDIYISNYRLCPNYLWVNNGDGTFSEEAIARGVAGVRISGYYGHTIGSCWGDINNDGLFDLFASNLAHPRFIDFSDKSMMYFNQGAPFYVFEDIREYAGITYYETHSSPAFADYDNDGWIDLFITCVYVGYYSFLYKNNHDMTFTNVNYESGVYLDNGWGCAWADYDNDGDMDLAARPNGPLYLYRNNGNPNNWIKFKLVGTVSNAFGIGAVVKVKCGDMWQMRQVEAGTGTQGCQNSMIQHFGLADASIVDTVIILWSTGIVDTAVNLPANDWYIATEGGEVVSRINEKPDNLLPLDFEIVKCYPNPFNSNTSIEVYVPIGSRLKMALYDINGKLAELIYDGYIEKGKHRITWNFSDKLSSGIYLVKASVNNLIVRSAKIIIIK